MSLEVSIYNRQKQTSRSGKTYIAYTVVFTPGQRGATPASSEVPPFYVRNYRSGQQWIRLTAQTLSAAKIEAEKQQNILQAVAKDVAVVTTREDRESLSARIGMWLNEVEANRAKSTWDAYRRSLELFQQSCFRLTVSAVRREDLLQFKSFLKKHEQNFSDRSIFNYFLNTMIFFAAMAKDERHGGINYLGTGIEKNDWPAVTAREPEAYTEDELKKLLETAATTFRGLERKTEKKDDRLLLNTFLCSGFRSGEVEYLVYGDIEVETSIWKVLPKRGHDLKTEGSQREVPVPRWLTEKVMERKQVEKRQNADLIFPNSSGKPDDHLIRIVKRIAKKAGVSGRVDDHKFRSTRITQWLQDGQTVVDVGKWVGHKSLDTIQHYAEKINLRKKENLERATRSSEKYAGIGD